MTVRDLATLGAAATSRLAQSGDSVGVVETSAGGLVAAALLAAPGASKWFRGGLVLYTYEAREEFLGLSTAKMGMGLVRSASVAAAVLYARQMRVRLNTTWAVAETGAAGPTGNRYGDAAGHTCLAISGPVERGMTIETGSDDRVANMWAFAEAALGLLTEAMTPTEGPRHPMSWR